MSTIVLRSVKGTPLTNTEVDTNFSNLNTDKIQIGGTYSSGTANALLYLNGSKVLTSGSALTFDGTSNLAVNSASNVTLNLTSTSGYSQLVFTGGSSANYIVSDDPLSFYIGVGGLEAMRLTASSFYTASQINVGIGNSNPQYPLDVSKAGGGNFVAYFKNTTNTTPYTVRIQEAASAANGYPLFDVVNSAGTNAHFLVHSGTGNVGIGTSSPQRKLSIANGGPVVEIDPAGISGTDPIYFNYNRSTSTYTTPQYWALAHNWMVNGGTSAMLLNSAGNLGIGNTTPTNYQADARQLVIGLTGTNGITVVSGTTGRGNLFFSDGTTGTEGYRGFLQYDHSLDNLNLGTDATTRVTINTSGNVGIGLTPNTWNAFTNVLQIKTASGAGAFAGSGNDNFRMLCNTYYNSGYFRVGAGYAGIYEQAVGGHFWYTGGSSTANSAYTPGLLMGLDNGGNLTVGGSSVFGRISVNATTNATDIAFIGYQSSATSTQKVVIGAYSNGLYGVSINALTNYAGTAATTMSFSTTDGSATSYERLWLSPTGNLGLGEAPNASWATVSPVIQFPAGGFVGAQGGVNTFYIGSNHYYNGSNFIHTQTGFAAQYQCGGGDGSHTWRSTSVSGSGGAIAPLGITMRLESGGNLLVGGSTSYGRLTVRGYKAITTFGNVSFSTSDDATSTFYIAHPAGSVILSSDNALAFGAGSGAASIERARIATNGFAHFSASGSYYNASGSWHSFESATADDTAIILNSNASPYGINVFFNGATPNNSGNYFYNSLDGSGTTRFRVYSNGGIANYSANNVNLSDRREKTNFAPSGSYLEKICAIPVQTFNYIDQNMEEDGGLTLGVVAQDVQAVAPELVMESNWASKDEEPKMRLSIYQTDMQYALMKCIQEQQAIIESLKARLDAANL